MPRWSSSRTRLCMSSVADSSCGISIQSCWYWWISPHVAPGSIAANNPAANAITDRGIVHCVRNTPAALKNVRREWKLTQTRVASARCSKPRPSQKPRLSERRSRRFAVREAVRLTTSYRTRAAPACSASSHDLPRSESASQGPITTSYRTRVRRSLPFPSTGRPRLLPTSFAKHPCSGRGTSQVSRLPYISQIVPAAPLAPETVRRRDRKVRPLYVEPADAGDY